MNSLDWNILDWILVAIGFFCLIRGIWRGGISQVFGITGILGGYFLGAYYCEDIAKQLIRALPSLPSPRGIAFSLLFFLTWFCLGCIGYWLGKLTRHKGLGLMDRLWGAGIGLAKAVVLAIVLVSFLTFFRAPNTPLLANSQLAPYVHAMAGLLAKMTPKSLQDLFEKNREELQKYWGEKEKAMKERLKKENVKKT